MKATCQSAVAHPEEVVGVQRHPRVEQRVGDRRLDVVVGEGQHHGAEGEGRVQLPGPGAAGPQVQEQRDPCRPDRQQHQVAIHDRVGVRQRHRQQPERRARQIEIGEGPRLDAVVENLGQLPHGRQDPRNPARHRAPTAGPAPRDIRPPGASPDRRRNAHGPGPRSCRPRRGRSAVSPGRTACR